MAPIAVGDVLPDVEVLVSGEKTSLKHLFQSKKGVIFAVPGAFTPVCSEKHLPGFKEKLTQLKEKGAMFVGCLAVNDPFVMKAWFKSLEVPDDLAMVCDGNGEFTKAVGMELDLSDKNLGIRSQRFAMIVSPGGKVEWIGKDESSFVESVLEHL